MSILVMLPTLCTVRHIGTQLRARCFRKIARNLGTSTAGAMQKDWNGHEEFFNFTRGRFVVDEQEQMAERHIKFDMNQLARIAAKSVGANTCTNVEKCDDGMFNKVYIFTLDNGMQVIGKVPNPNAGMPHYTTANEVATIDFARTVLGTPAPKVYGWNSQVDDMNTVGAEYIIMEKFDGIQLARVWPFLAPAEKMKIFLQIFNYQKAWTATNFEDFGSLYYIDDVNETMRRSTKPVFDKFVVGPAAGREWVDHGRSKLQCDRGPWRSLQEYRQATGLREKSAIKTFSDTPVPKQLTMLYGPDLYQPTLKKRLEAAESYLQLLSLLLPTDSALTSGHIWHNDLHGENIFVSQNMPTQVIGIIDWQSIQIAPLFDHCMDPTFLEYSGTPIGDSLKRPELPDTKSMSKDERDLAIKHYLDMSVMVAWRMLVKKKNPAQYRAILFEFTTEGYLLHLSRRLYELGEAYFSALLLDLCTERGNENFPLVFSEERKLEIEGDREAAQLSSEAMRDLERRLDGLWPEKALIEHENYDEVKSRLREVKEELAVKYSGREREAFEQLWPFDS